MEDYEKLLNKAYEEVKPIEKTSGIRFELPKINSNLEGNKTIFVNFGQVCDYLKRPRAHVEKYLEKALAVPGKIEGDRLIFAGKVSNQKIKDKMEEYVKDFIICKECGKHDTELVKQDHFYFVHCLACGASHAVSYKT